MHPLADQDSITLAELASLPLVLLDSVPSRDNILAVFAAAGVTPTIAYRSPDYEFVRSMVGNGLGYTLLETRPASPITLDGRLTVARPLSDSCEKSQIVLVTDTSREISDEARAVHAYIVDQLGKHQH
jgi:DNA-binding transcriptional LysR family regulator